MKYPITIILLFISFLASAQNKELSSIKNIENIKPYISKNYKIDRGFIDTACMNTVVFVKFNVVGDHIGSLVFSKNAPSEIKRALKAAFLSTNGFWKLTKDQSGVKKIFLLPVALYYQIGCTPGGQILTKVTDKGDLSSLMKRISLDAPFHSAFQNMLQFEDGSNYPSLNCTLISPLVLGMME